MADLRLDASFVIAEIANLKTMYPELDGDGELLQSAIEGETNFDEVMDDIIGAILETASLKSAIAERQSALRERGERFDRRTEALKTLALKLMLHAEQSKVQRPEATLFVRTGNKRVVIDNESELPQGFVRIERVPIKDAISKSIEAGAEVPGAHVERGPTTVSIRTK